MLNIKEDWNGWKCEFNNAQGEHIDVRLYKMQHDKKYKNGLMNLWVKHGYMKEFLPETLNAEVFVTDKDGNCRGDYNPQEAPAGNRPGRVIDFYWMLANTADNRERIISEIYRRATYHDPRYILATKNTHKNARRHIAYRGTLEECRQYAENINHKLYHVDLYAGNWQHVETL